MRIKQNILGGDKIIWTIYILLIFVSIVEVFSSMGKMLSDSLNGNYGTMLTKHVLMLLLGFCTCFVCHRISYKKLSQFSGIFLVMSVILLIATLIIAKVTHNPMAARWIRIPYLGQFQPSEIAKYVLIFYLAQQMAECGQKIHTKEVFYRLLIPIIIVTLLILPENFSTSLLVFITCLLLMFIGGVNRKLLAKLVLGITAIGLLFILLANAAPKVLLAIPIDRMPTWVSRIQGFGDSDYTEINQRNLALMAVSTGGLMGIGIGKTVQARFLDEGHNDFIYSIMLEEGGIIFGLMIILLYEILLYRILKTAKNAPGLFGTLTCIGIGLIIVLQAIINMSVSVGLIPVTGQTLPFISYGGTSFVISSAFLGIVLNISKNRPATGSIIATEQEEQETGDITEKQQ